MPFKKKPSFIKSKFDSLPQAEKDEFMDDDVQEIVVEHKSGFNMVEVLIIIIISIAFGVFIGCSVSFFKQEYHGEKVSSSLQELITVYNNILDDYYKDINESDLVDAAIEGMLSSLDDPYSTYMDEKNSQVFNETVSGSYIGIGVTIAVKEDGQFVVQRIIENSPAQEAGIQAGDYLLKVDGKSLNNVNLNDITSLIQGSEGDLLNLTLVRNGKEFDVSVNISSIDFVSVISKVYALNNGNAGYISISTFAANTYEQFKKELQKLENKNINSLIIDVRSNPGGHVSQTRDILELFMKKDSILYQVQFKNDINKVKDNTKKSRNYPVVVLINSSSASAAEILTAAFQDSYFDTTVVGETTYGKGTIQTAYTLSDGTSVKYTTEKWLTPKGKWIDGKGLTPDIVVQLSEAYFSNPIPENDLQLQKALDFLEKERNTRDD